MVYGPCGGVRPDHSCEMDARRPCPFAGLESPVPWSGTTPRPEAGLETGSRLLEAVAAGRPVVLTDLTLPAYDAEAVGTLTRVLRDSCDALLVGEHQNQPDFSPALMAQLIAGAGGTGWLTLTCRDRNRVVLEAELASLRLAGADGVLCVTGDGRAHGVRPEVTQVFDLDGTRLAALAAARGLPAAVAESPAAPPRALRPQRLLEKQRAGARLAVLNSVGDAGEVRDFVAAARDLGVTLPVVAAVAVYTDEPSALALQRLPGLQLDPDGVRRVLTAVDPQRAGVEAAVAQAHELLEIEQVAGVNVSGLATGRGVMAVAEVKAEVGRRIRALR